jgi:Cu(I)/Ag(I) efflux system membrane fusion protein
MKMNNLIWSVLTLGFMAGAAIVFFRFDSVGESMVDGVTAGGQNDGQPLYWVAPMDSNYRRDEPGLSPMGMELVPVYEEGNDDYSIRVSSAIQQNLGLRTARVLRGDLAKQIRAVGYTRWNESSIEMLHPRAEGWLEVFNLASVGDRVEAGQVLYELFSPNLVSAQREYLIARQSQNPTLMTTARDRLLALGFTREQINTIEQSGEIAQRLVYRAERDAIVTHIGVREGNFIQPQTHIATLASLDIIWVDSEVFESDAGEIMSSLPVSISFPAYPGETWSGEVAYVYPELDPMTRTQQFRLEINNADQRLRPNMFANVLLESKPRPSVLTVPREAVIRSGAGARVILALQEGRFQAQPVTTGLSSGGRTEILNGLNEGDTVVSSGQFLLDAEANGEQALARLMGAEAEGASNMDTMAEGMEAMEMPEMEMDDMGDMSMPDMEDSSERFSASGTIRRMGDEQITISHEPVEALNWPSMTMGFDIDEAVNLDDFDIEDPVVFEFEQGDGGMYRLITIEHQEAAP